MLLSIVLLLLVVQMNYGLAGALLSKDSLQSLIDTPVWLVCVMNKKLFFCSFCLKFFFSF